MESTSKNVEIRKEFGQLLETGKVVVFAVGDSSPGKDGKDYTTLYVCQEVEGRNTVSKLDEMFLQWNSKTIVRALRNALTTVVEQMKVLPGHVIDGCSIQVDEDFTPRYEGQDPKQTPAGNVLLGKENGLPIYRHTTLVDGEANNHFEPNAPLVNTGLVDISKEKSKEKVKN